MPETTLHPSKGPKRDTIVAQQGPLNQYEALREVGWIQPIDYLAIVLIILSWLTLLAWCIFGKPTPWNLFTCVLVAFGITQAWTVLLIFRGSHFVLLIRAYLDTLPAEAARLVMSNYSGQEAPPPR